MIIFLSELQKDHLELLTQHSTQVVVDFCKLAIDYLNNGMNQTKYKTAAGKLDVSTTAIQNLVHAIIFLLVEGAKHNLSELDFKSSLAIAGFPPEHQEILVKLFNNKKAELFECLHILQQNDPTYQDFTWRLEVQVASRNGSEAVKPTVAMDFVVKTPKNFGQLSDNSMKKQLSSLEINSSIQDAKAASQCQNVISHLLLQSDLPNLLHMTNKLDQALKESKSQHVRKVQRALQ